MKKITSAIIGLLIGLLLVAMFLFYSTTGQNILLSAMAKAAMTRTSYDTSLDAIQVYMCGTSSPLPSTSRAQACVALVTPKHFFIIDAGAGSASNITLARLPMQRLDGVLVTHFHSDHIAELYEINLNAWVAGKKAGVTIYGPAGVDEVVSGLNTAYRHDRSYRVGHHGADFLPPEAGLLRSRTTSLGEVFHDGDFRITAFATDHPPVAPTLGYKFHYKDRVVAVTGDTLLSTEVISQTQDADLLLVDAASMTILDSIANAAEANGRPRNAKILRDIKDYHASTESIAALANQAEITKIGLYHLVPPPQNLLMENIYMRGMPSKVLLTKDRQWFVLEAGIKTVGIH